MCKTAGAFGSPAFDWFSRTRLADASGEWILSAPCSGKVAMIYVQSLIIGNFTNGNQGTGTAASHVIVSPDGVKRPAPTSLIEKVYKLMNG
jgi:hypothetical protein